MKIMFTQKEKTKKVAVMVSTLLSKQTVYDCIMPG